MVTCNLGYISKGGRYMSALDRVGSGVFELIGYRSRPEILRDLAPIREKIAVEAKQALAWHHTIPQVAKGVFRRFVNEPVGSIFKLILIGGVSYVSYLLFKGIAAGIEVDSDSSFIDLFSQNLTTRLNAGLNLTNGEQAGQFIIDLVLTIYATYRFLIRKPYYTFVSETLNTIYNNYLSQLWTQKINSQNDPIHHLQAKENLDELFQELREKLKAYESEPTFHEQLQGIAPLEVIVDD